MQNTHNTSRELLACSTRALCVALVVGAGGWLVCGGVEERCSSRMVDCLLLALSFASSVSPLYLRKLASEEVSTMYSHRNGRKIT